MLRVRTLEDRRHAHAHQHHERGRHDRRRAPLPGLAGDGAERTLEGCRVRVARRARRVRHAAEDERRQQHLDVNGHRRIEHRAPDVQQLAGAHDQGGVDQDPAPGDAHLDLVQPAVGHDQHHGHHHHDEAELPGDADHQHLQGNHQEHRVEVVEYRQNARPAKHPGRTQARGGQHAEQDASGGRRGKAPGQQRLLPGVEVGPDLRREHREDEVAGREQPRERRGGEGHHVVPAVFLQVGLVEVKLVADLDHDEGQAGHRQQPDGVRNDVARISRQRRQHLREPQADEEK